MQKLPSPGYIWGDKDTIFVPELIAQVDDIERNMRTVKLARVNHWTSIEQPERATRAIIDFLAE